MSSSRISQQKLAIDRRIQAAFNALPNTASAQKEINDLRPKIDLLSQEASKDNRYVYLTDAIKLLQQTSRDFETEIRESPRLAASSVKVEAFEEEIRLNEEKIAQQTMLKRLKTSFENEKDRKKKAELQTTYVELLKTKMAIDPARQIAIIVNQRVRRQHQELLRREFQAHEGWARVSDRIATLRKDQKALLIRLKESNRELAELEKVVRGKQEALNLKRQRFEKTEKARAKALYTKVAETIGATRKALDAERTRIEQSSQMAKLISRIDSLKKEQLVLRDKYLRDANLSGRNPYPGDEAAKLWNFQQNLEYHKSADWDERTKEEVADEVTPRLKEWLQRVRGY